MKYGKKIKPELLSPAGDFEKLKVAFHYGADAVYVGMKEFSLRANTKNFDENSLKLAIAYAHNIGKKIYVAFNVYFFPDQSEAVLKNLKILDDLKPDGIIVSDPGILYIMKENGINLRVHISTQANTTNQHAVKLYKSLGASRIVLARELTLAQIKTISDNVTDIELETFVHGAMCIAYSGRCLLSSYMTTGGLGKRRDDESNETRSANRGDCSHSCRWEFILKEKTRPGQNYELTENDEGSYILSSKDICMIDNLPDLIGAGIGSFKIEGRMKSILYISSIVRAYRQAVDHYFDKDVIFDRAMIEKELNAVSHREFSTGFFYDTPMNGSNVTENPVYKREMRLAALIEGIKNDRFILKIYNKIIPGIKMEFIGRKMKTGKVGKIVFYDIQGNVMDIANHGQYAEAEIFDDKDNPADCEILDILRMESDF